MPKISSHSSSFLTALAFTFLATICQAFSSANAAFSQATVQSGVSPDPQRALRIPKTPDGCETEECKWWNLLRGAAEDVLTADARKTQVIAEAYAQARRDGRLSLLAPLPPESAMVAPDTLAKLYSDIELATTNYFKLLNESHRIPLPDSSAQKPVIIRKQEARYTEEARSAKLQGVVVLSAAFHADGTMKDIRVVRGLKQGLTEQAIEAAKGILFLPAIKDGKFVAVRGNLEYNFMLY